MPVRIVALSLVLLFCAACGPEPSEPAASTGSAATPTPEPGPEAASDEPASYPRGIVLALAQFVEKDGKSVPGPAQLEFLFREGGEWRTRTLDDADSNVFHKAMLYSGGGEDVILTVAGTAATVKTWAKQGSALVPTTHWTQDFGGKFSRMRDAEVGDLYGDGKASIAVATHDQGVVAVLRPEADGFSVVELDAKPNTFVHEIEIGDLDGDGVLEVYATPSEPNRLDGTPQRGQVVRYVPARGEGPSVVADLGERHAKEILVEDVDGDGRDELYVVVEGHLENKKLVDPVEIRRYEAATPADQGVVIATLEDQLCRFLTAGDVDGDGKLELVAAAYKAGVWLLRPGADVNQSWRAEQIDADSGGFEHASILTDLDGDGVDELYVASDADKAIRRYRWDGGRAVRETLHQRRDGRPIFTWNLMPLPAELVPGP
ncbi:MAG: VCBS repeat-containing protein [Deltaproteobacteria bacterium]|nr:VCBS repeat-containing protein [Deltaproteobacteria bacterium]MBW2361320.1 VCBS repeat-containing protein [Deltaproteobacteria bacterium]